MRQLATIEEEPTTITAKYARDFYDALVKRARTEILEGDPIAPLIAGNEVLVFRGKLSPIFQSLGISNIYYSKIRRIFIKYDCVLYLQRGTRSYDSVLILNRPPPDNLAAEDLTERPGDATLSAVAERVAELEHEVEVLRKWRESLGGLDILKAFRELNLAVLKRENAGEES